MDSGNCLDYTDTPENNDRPGQVNFERLRDLYLDESDNGDTADGVQGNSGGGNRNLR